MSTRQWQGGEFNPTFGVATGAVAPTPKPWPTPEQQRGNPNWTAKMPRPKADDGACPDYVLEGRQQVWDAAEEKRQEREAHHAEWRAGQEQRKREASAVHEAEFERRQEAAAAAREAELRAVYFANGGTPTGWEAEREAILAADRQQRTLEGSAGSQSLIDVKRFI